MTDKQTKRNNLIDRVKPYQWKPGQSGNPNGRPPNVKYISEGLREYLEAHPDELKKMIAAAVKKSMAGDIQAFREVADRTEGKVTETHKFEGEIPVSIRYKLKEEENAQGTE
ncbi:hypothetical protein LCGC14_0801810 [marine sediment metagenome]|uniref:DUF5681 domain-containing protein n=1 Tax=marine sediment metagenome TaxID=412755 RepID=A0A0F9Q9B4_9ZZZZ